jgi:hypothetical protein
MASRFRYRNVRFIGAALTGIDFTNGMQVIAQLGNFASEEEFNGVNGLIKRGDVVGLNGNPGQ